MAIVRPSPIITQISGSLGSVTFRRGRGCTILARRPTKTRVQSLAQLERRAALARATHHWAALSSDDKATWANVATQITHTNPLGQRIKYTGFQLAVRHNTFRALAAIPMIDVPPASVSAPGPDYAYITLGPTIITGVCHFQSPVTVRRVWYFAQRCFQCRPVGTNYWTFIKYYSGQATDFDALRTEFEAKLGHPDAGECVKYRIISQAHDYLLAAAYEGSTLTIGAP